LHFEEEIMKSVRILLTAVMVIGLLAPLWALQQKAPAKEISAQEKQMMEMMQKYAAPGKHHEFLKKYVGNWDVEVKSWAKPGDEPMMSKGTIKAQLIFEGRFVRSHFEGDMMNMKFVGMEIIGYDLFQNKYVSFWIDNMTTAFMTTSGTLDASGMVLTETGMSGNPMSGGMQKTKEVTTFMPDGKYKFEMYMGMPDGSEFKSMEFVAGKKMM
jgi:hypothetical protein